MNPFLFKIAYKMAQRYVKLEKDNKTSVARKINHNIINFVYSCKSSVFIVLGVLSASFGLKGFLLPNEFIDGGVTGISLLVSIKLAVPLSILIVIINAPFFIFGIKQIGKVFIIKSFVAIALLSLAILVIDVPVVTEEKILASVFGGFFLGIGIGLSIRGGAVIDGTEILAIYVSKRTGFTVGDIIALFNIMIFSVAAYLLSVDQALFAIITYLSASKAADFIIEGIDEYTGVTIISNHSEEIRYMITHKLGRGVTILKGQRGYTRVGERPDDIDVLYTVITRLEISRLKKEITLIDDRAFLTFSKINDTKGGMVKRKLV